MAGRSEDASRHRDHAGWARAADLFERALEVPSRERAAWLLAEAGHDPALLETVRRMLAADAEAGGLLDEGIAPAAHLVLEPEVSLEPGTRVAAFDIIGELGRGGMGVVYAARDRHLDRPVALKFVRARRDGERGATERLLGEARAASALDHPNVASIYQVGETNDGRYFLAMQRCEGETLRSRLRGGPLPASEALGIARQVASGLAAAHRAGIVHGDITPNNIFLTSDGPVKILDFGLASLLGPAGRPTEATGATRGTIGYMSPEQARGDLTDARTDVWSLGVVLHRMLAGTLPFPGETPAEVLAAIRGSDLVPRLAGRPGVPRRLARVVDRALSREPARRYADAGRMLEALERAASPPSAARVLVALVAVIVVGAALALTLGGGTGSEWPVGTSGDRTLAILPAAPAAGDSTTEYLAAGITAHLADRLARLRRVRVKGPLAVVGSGVDLASPPQTLGKALEVEYFVAGDFRRPDSLLVVSLRLFDAREGVRVWADDYTGAPGDLLALQDTIARDLAGAVAGELSAEERAALGARLTSSPLAYDHFLRGDYLLGKRTPAALLEASRAYDVAIDADPRFAEAFAGRAYTNLLFLDWGWPYPGRTHAELLGETRRLVERALELDPGSARVWLARAYERVVSDPGRFEGALPAFERSLRRDSLDPEARHQHGQTLMALGRYDEAVDAYLRALELEPARPMTLVPLAAIAMQRGREEEAMRWADSAVGTTRRVPAPYALSVRAHIALGLGDPQGARRDAERALELDDSYPAPALSALAVARARLGEEEAALTTLRRLLETIDRDAPTPTDARFVGSALFALGRADDALTLIERARPRGALLWYYLQSRDFDPYRSLPRFQAVDRAADPRAGAAGAEG